MVSDSFVVVVVVNAVICSILGAVIGGRRDSAGNGAILGFLFGELGLIVAFALDGRPTCSQCGERVNRDARLCSHCRSPIYWWGGQQFETQAEFLSKRANQLEAERAERAGLLEAERIWQARSAAFRAWMWGMAKTILKVTLELLKQCVPVVQRLWGVVKTILMAAVVTLVTACAWLWVMAKTGFKASVTGIRCEIRKLADDFFGGDSYAAVIVLFPVLIVLFFVLIGAATSTFDILWDFSHLDAPAAVTEVQQPAVAPVGQLNPPVTVAPEPTPEPQALVELVRPADRIAPPVVPAAIIPDHPVSIPEQPVGPLESPSNTLIGKQPGDSQEITLPGGVKLKLVWCPPGTFTMGTPGATNDEAPVQVTLKGYWIAETETTQGQWTRVMGLYSKPWSGQTLVKEGPNFAASCISHEDAEAYCVNLSEIERRDGRLPTGWMYALPTEAQWEYACRAGTTTQYSFGDDESSLGEYAWFDKNVWDIGKPYAHAVGTKQPNPWGLRDMHGNVWEWCRDGYAGKLVGGPNPAGPSTSSYRVFRGGCWINSAGFCRSAFRRRRVPSGRDCYLGFRVVRTQYSQPIPSPVSNALVDVEVSPVVDEVEAETVKPQAESKSRVPADDFDTTVNKLPGSVKGHDPVALYKGLRGRLNGLRPQDEKETEDQYNSRLRQALENPFMGKLGVDSTFVFPTYQLFSPYNEEDRRFEFSVYSELQSEGIGFESPFSKFESAMKDSARKRGRPLGIPQPQIVITFSNAFEDFLQVQVPMNPSTARASQQHLRVLYLARLEPPYLIEETFGTGFSLPPKITMSLSGVWIVRADSRAVIAKRKQGEIDGSID